VPVAIAAVMAGANGGKHAGFGQGQGNHLLDDPQDKLGASGDVEFLEEAVQMRVNGVSRYAESTGNLRLREIVKDALDDLQLALRQGLSAANLKPGMIAEQGSSPQLAV
jgi:hypothetical protein